MQPDTVNFEIVSGDSDAYLLNFIVKENYTSSVLQTLSEAIQFRIAQIIDQSALKPLGLSTKSDVFDMEKINAGYIEMDLLHYSSSVISFEAYLYDAHNALRGKASCTIYFEANASQPLAL